MADTTENNRKFERIYFDCLVEFEAGDSRHLCELYDISLQGALIGNCTGASPGSGTPCKLTLSLSSSGDAQIIMDGSIAHKKDNRIGIKCEKIDIDSMIHLRKLVEMNQVNTELLDREINFLWSQAEEQ